MQTTTMQGERSLKQMEVQAVLVRLVVLLYREKAIGDGGLAA